MRDPEKEKVPWWRVWLEGSWWDGSGPTGARLTGITIRLQINGLFAILKRHRGEEKEVSFVGAKTFPSLAKKMMKRIREDEGKWKPDKYA